MIRKSSFPADLKIKDAQRYLLNVLIWRLNPKIHHDGWILLSQRPDCINKKVERSVTARGNINRRRNPVAQPRQPPFGLLGLLQDAPSYLVEMLPRWRQRNAGSGTL